MTQNKKKLRKARLARVKRAIPYLFTFVAVLGIAYFGSRDKTVSSGSNMNMQSIASNNYAVSADQISEFFIVSELANSMQLATAEAVNLNYNTLSIAREFSQNTSSVDKLEKPDIVDTSHLSRGVISYSVGFGDTLTSIAQRYNLTETQIRYSNGLPNSTIVPGQILYLPSMPGIVYTVRSGDTLEGIASRYGSALSSITTANDLETGATLAPGAKIVLPGGTLPATERPEYTVTANSSAYRTYWTSSNPMPWGWCTWYAWSRRSTMGEKYKLPGGLGNANTWDNVLSRTYRMDRTPAVGAIFQTDVGYYGHVGIVDEVYPDGSIKISDMNGIAGWGRVGTRVITAAEAKAYKYIHERL